MNTHFKSAQLFLEELQNNPPRLPYDPKIISDLFEMTSSKSNVAIKEVANLIEKEPGLTAKILRLSNSPRYSLLSQVSTAIAAVTVLGLNEVRNLIIITGVSLSIKPKKLPAQFNLKGLWKHQLMTGECTRTLCNLQKETNTNLFTNPDEVYTASLLHDLGKVMIAYLRPNDWIAINDLEQKENISTQEAEDTYWGLDHGLIAGRVLEGWGIPHSLTEPITWHHYPELAKEHKNTTFLITTANYIASEWQNILNNWQQELNHNEYLPQKINEYIDYLGLNFADIMPNMLKTFESNNCLSIAEQL